MKHPQSSVLWLLKATPKHRVELPALRRAAAALSEGFRLAWSREQKFCLSGKLVCPSNSVV